MKTAILSREGFFLHEVPVPEPAAGELLIRSLALGICEGDLFQYRSRADLGDKTLQLGHEGTGEIVALGAGVTGFTVGQRVTTLGGYFAEYYTAPADQAIVLAEGEDPTYALGEPLACCVHASTRFGIYPGDRVALIGCGFMGSMCMHLARMQGAAEIVVFEPMPWRQETALRAGADAAYDPRTVDLESVGLFDVILEATGVQSGIDLIAPLIKQHGRAVVIGYHQTNGGQRQVDMKTWNSKAIDVINGHVRRNGEKMAAMSGAMGLVHAGLLPLKDLVTPYAFADISTAMADLDARKVGLYKAVLLP